jgi:integrase
VTLHYLPHTTTDPHSGTRPTGYHSVTSGAPIQGSAPLLHRYQESLERRHLAHTTIRLRMFHIVKLDRASSSLLDLMLPDLELYFSAHRTWSPNTKQSVTASIRSFYRWAHDDGLMTYNPAAELHVERVHQPTARIADEQQIIDGLERATPPEQAMILLGAECGLRVSEIAALHNRDRVGEWITIIGKGNVQRTVWVTPELQLILDQLEREYSRWGFYFPGRSGGHVHPSMVWRHVRALTGANTHALRHRAGTQVYRNTGNDLRTAQVFLGHKRPETTAIYVHVQHDDLRRAGQGARVAA